MAESLIVCSFCGKEKLKSNGHINRAVRDGKPMFCNKTCFGLSERSGKSKKQLIEEKREYDKKYRQKNLEAIKEKKAKYYKDNHDPVKEAIKRKKRSKQHAEYCRTPKYKEWKKEYDKKHRAKKNYGEYWEAFLLSMEIKEEVDSRMSKYQIRLEAETLNKCQRRKRDEQANSKKLERSPMGHS